MRRRSGRCESPRAGRRSTGLPGLHANEVKPTPLKLKIARRHSLVHGAGGQVGALVRPVLALFGGEHAGA
jgi:hypothetical protein